MSADHLPGFEEREAFYNRVYEHKTRAYGRDNEFTIRSPHGDWKVIVSMYAMDSLPASALAGHAKNQLLPVSQLGYVWYLTEDGRRLPDAELVRCDRPREFNLCMEMP